MKKAQKSSRNRPRRRPKRFAFVLSGVGFAALILILTFELGAQLVLALKVLPSFDSLPINADTAWEAPALGSTVSPHPYFGFVFTPNTRVHLGSWMNSNSEGFIDEDFPFVKEPGHCVYGLMGGSLAMSWGTADDSKRISSQLEEMLNKKPLHAGCKKYRVLNMGLPSQHVYQSAQVFLYYRSRLSGAIFLIGNNECWHATVPGNSQPVNFPEWSLNSILAADQSKVAAIRKFRKKIKKLKDFRERFAFLSRSATVQVVMGSIARKHLVDVQQLNEDLVAAPVDKGFPLLNDGLSKNLPAPKRDYMYTDQKSVALFLEKTIPRLFIEPLAAVGAVARAEKLPVVTVIQPLFATIDRTLSADEKKRCPKFPLFQKVCMEEFVTPSFQRLSQAGMPAVDLNKRKLFSNMKSDLFIDETHMSEEGNKIIAQFLYDYIKANWKP